jgi:hypothetical protein
MAKRPNERITVTTPVAVACLSKTVQVARTDTTAFEAFVLPKGAVICGAYVMGGVASDAETSAIIDVGTNPGTADEIIDGFDVKTSGKSYSVAGTAVGTAMGSQLTADTLYKAKYTEAGTASTTGGPWLVKVEYYFPQQGNSF